MESLTHCIITEIGREYGEGTTRTIKGVALHHKIFDGSRSSKKGIVDTLTNGINNSSLNDYLTIANAVTNAPFDIVSQEIWAIQEASKYIINSN